MTIDPDECVRIVEELGKHCADPSNDRLRNALLSAGVRDRILAAVKPKAKWPPRIEGQIIYGQRDATTLDGQFDAAEMNTIAVAWFEEQGVDLRVIADLNGLLQGGSNAEMIRSLRAILDNAGAD